MIQDGVYIRSRGQAGNRFTDLQTYVPKRRVTGTILFGLMVLTVSANLDFCRLPFADKFTFSAAITTGQSVIGKISINGVVSTFTPVAFNTNNATTLTDVATYIATFNTTDVPVTASVVSGSIVVDTTAGNEVYVFDIAVSGGSQTVTYDSTRKIEGGTSIYPKEQDLDGTLIMRQTQDDQAHVLKIGDMWYICEDTGIDPTKDDVYVRVKAESGKQVGAIKKSADGGAAILVPNARFLSAEDSSNGVKVVPVLLS